MSLEPTPAMTAAPSPSESGDITTALLRLFKNKFHGTILCLISLNDPSDRVYFWCASALIIHTICLISLNDPSDRVYSWCASALCLISLNIRGMFEMNCLFLSGDFKFQVSSKVLISCPRSTPRGKKCKVSADVSTS